MKNKNNLIDFQAKLSSWFEAPARGVGKRWALAKAEAQVFGRSVQLDRTGGGASATAVAASWAMEVS